MRVFLVPVGPAHHVPYCEPAEADASAAGPHDTVGYVARAVKAFRHFIATVEGNRLSHDRVVDEGGGWARRLKIWAIRWLADRIAEQRLLWQLRGCHTATLVYPSDLEGPSALELLHAELKRDGDRHRRWIVVDAVLLVLSAVLALLPGPNLIAYYFVFRVVGHYFSMRGANQGLLRVTWALEVSSPLHDLRTVLQLDPHTRRSRVRDIATRLDLPNLVTFVERVALRGA